MAERDWTQDEATAGEPIPADAIDASTLSFGGAESSLDADKIESENSFHDLGPGDYLLKIVGLGSAKKKYVDTHINGRKVGYEAVQIEVRFADANNPSGRIRGWFLVPPKDALGNAGYNNGKKADGKDDTFVPRIFIHFIDRLLPGKAFEATPNGGKRLTAFAGIPTNWIGKPVWAQVENGREEKDPAKVKVDPKTGEPYPPRPQLRSFSYRSYIPGEPSPYGTANAAPSKSEAKRQAVGNPARQPVGVGAAASSSANGHAAGSSYEDSGLDAV